MELSNTHLAVPLSPAKRLCCSAKHGTCAAWVQPSGELDLATAPVLEWRLREALFHARIVVLDLRHLSFIDAAGLHVICDASDRANAQGRRLMVMRGPAQVDRVFTLTGVSEKLVIFDVAEGDEHLPDARALAAA